MSYDSLRMGLLESVRVLGAMGRVTLPTLLEAIRGRLERGAIDERTHYFARRVVELLDVQLVATGGEQVPTDRAYVYMSNHQSHLDIPILYASLPSRTIRMLAKKELFEIPLWGRGLRAAEFVEVDRGDHSKAIAAIDEAARLMADGVSIWLAAEGTRSRTGAIGKLKKGGFHLALDTGSPIVPVAIKGTIDILPRGAKVMRTGVPVEVHIGAPIPVAGRTVEDLMDEVRAFLVDHVEH